MSFLHEYFPTILGILASLITAMWLGLFYTQQISEEFIWSAITSSTISLLILFATISIYLSARSLSKKTPSYDTYWGIFVAWLFYALGELTWTGFNIINRTDPPYPSIADLFWVIGTILLINELYLFTSNFKVSIKRGQLLKAFIGAGIVILALYAIAFNKIVLANFDETYDPFNKAMDIFYFTADALLVFFSLYIALAITSSTKIAIKEKMTHKNVPWGWIFLIMGMFFMIAADTYFTFLEWQGNPGLFRIDDVLYVLQYYFWTLGALLLPQNVVQEAALREPENISLSTNDDTTIEKAGTENLPSTLTNPPTP